MADDEKKNLRETGGDYSDFHGQDCIEGCSMPDPTRHIKGDPPNIDQQ